MPHSISLFSALLLLTACAGAPTAPAPAAGTTGPVVIATWPFGRIANEHALAKLQAGGSRLDAVEAGIREIERLRRRRGPAVRCLGESGEWSWA